MHGHQIRRAAQVDRMDLWADVKVGSLYAALKRLAAEGVIEVVRTEQEGNLPPRTIYAITEEGRNELDAIRDAVLRDTTMRPDPVDLALQFSLHLSEGQLRAEIEDRRRAIAADLAFWERTHTHAAPYLSGFEELGFEHRFMRLRTELAWHDRLLEDLSLVLANDKANDKANDQSEKGDP